MKKVILAVMFASIMAVGAQAQLFVGGSVGFDFEEKTRTTGSTISNLPLGVSFDFSPKVGYYLREKLAAGVMISLEIGFENDRANDPRKSSSFEWGFAPFMRYTTLSRGDFSLLLEGGAGVFGGWSKSTRGTNTTEGPKNFGIDAGVMPILSYSLTERVNLEVSSSLLRFGFSVESSKTGAGDSLWQETETSFGFGIDANHFFSSPYRIGLIFKF